MIQDGQKFAGPVELIKHHSEKLDGFLTKPSIPCQRPPGYPIAWPGVTYLQLEKALYAYAKKSNLKVCSLFSYMCVIYAEGVVFMMLTAYFWFQCHSDSVQECK